MPSNPDNWVGVINKLPPGIAGVFLAMFVAVLRVLYDKKETRPMRILLESAVCGGLSLTATYGILAMGLDSNWAIFTGGVIGYLGAETVRGFALTFIRRNIKK